MNKEYVPKLCILWAQADLGNLMIAFLTQMEKNSSDNEQLLDISRKIKEKAREIEDEFLRRIAHSF